MSKTRRYFLTGLFLLLPTFITVYLLYMAFRFVDNIGGKLINFYLKKHFGFGIPGLGIVLTFVIIFIVGFIATNFFGRKLFQTLEHWFLKFPLVRQIYIPAKQIVESFISQEQPAFKKVVMVEYPSKGIWSVGFLTNESFAEANTKAGSELLHIFIATTPSPLTGFLILVPKQNVVFLDGVSIENGIKLIVSGGIVKPPSSTAAPSGARATSC